MGVTIRQRADKTDGIWYVFVSYQNKRTSFKVGSKRAALELKDDIDVVLSLDRFMHRMQERGKTKPKLIAEAGKSYRKFEDLRLRLQRLLWSLDRLMARNLEDRGSRTRA